MVRECLRNGLIILSLDHDGVRAAVPFEKRAVFEKGSDFELNPQIRSPREFKTTQDFADNLCSIVSSGEFSNWSQYLLAEEIEIVAKRIIFQGKHHET